MNTEPSTARSIRPAEAPSATPSAASPGWATPLILADGRVYDVIKAEVQKPQTQPVDQSIVMQRCLIEVKGKHQRSTLRFEVRAYPTAFRRRLLDLRRASTLVIWARQWIAQYLSQPHRHTQSDSPIVVDCW